MYMKYATLLLLSLAFISQGSTPMPAKTDVTNDSTVKILTYGLMHFERIRALNTVGKKYGVVFHAVAGCVVTQELVDSVEIENSKTYRLLEQKFGCDWEARFEKEVALILKQQEEVELIVKREKYIIEKEKELEKQGKGLYFKIELTDTENIFDVKAFGWETINSESEEFVYYKMIVNLLDKKVTKTFESNEKSSDSH